jgi:hypothetical protein
MKLLLRTILVFGVIFSACKPNKAPNSVELIGDLHSNLSEEELRLHTSVGKYAWVTIYDKLIDSTSHGPRYHEKWIRIENYSDLSVTGALELEFMNERLTSTYFYPINESAYDDSSLKYRALNFATNNTMKRNGLTIGKMRDPVRGSYYLWQDDRLISAAEVIAQHYD